MFRVSVHRQSGRDTRRLDRRTGGLMLRVNHCGVGIGLFFASATLTAQAPARDGHAAAATTSVSVLHTGHFSPVVADLDRAMSFYRDVLGLEIAAEPPSTWDAEPWLRRLHGTPDSAIRFATAKIPGVNWGIEMVEFKDSKRRPMQPRVQDPGACTVALSVRNLDAVLARLKRAGAPVVSTGGVPVDDFGSGETRYRAVLVRDPDGHFVEVFQATPLPATKARASSNVIGGGVRIVVENLDRSLALYRDQLGWPFGQATVSGGQGFRDLTGLPKATSRHSVATAPDGALYELVEFQGVNRNPLRTRVQDPGSTRFQLIVSDLEAALGRFKDAGGSVVSAGGQPVVENGVPYAFVRDLNGIFFVVWKGRS
jgi:predicted enzyme related to lactoylglutathione lyase